MSLKLRLKDMLEDEVDEKYYLKNKTIESFNRHKERHKEKGHGFGWSPTGGDTVAKTLETNPFRPSQNHIKEDAELKQVGQLYGTEREPNPQAGRVYDADGLSPTMDTCSGGNRMPKIVTGILSNKGTHLDKETDIANTLLARDYKGFGNQGGNGVIEVVKVGNTSPSGKSQCNDVYDPNGNYPSICAGTHGNCNPSIIENPQIQKVAIPQATKQGYVECEIGGVADLSYPKSKTRRGRVQENGNICPTITAESNGICRIEEQTMIIDDTYKNREERVYTENAPTIRAGREGLKVAEPFVVASRGRNPEKPSDRTFGAPTEQRLEPKFDGTTNTITTVQKDNYVAEPQQALKVDDEGNVTDEAVDLQEQTQFRIRKLTPKECWRLMGFDDGDFEKAEKVNSNTQLYKQAGNSIVVNVLEAIMKELGEVLEEFRGKE